MAFLKHFWAMSYKVVAFAATYAVTYVVEFVFAFAYCVCNDITLHTM